MRVLKGQIFTGLAIVVMAATVTVAPVRAVAPQVTFADQPMGGVLHSLTVGSGNSTKVFVINSSNGVMMETGDSATGAIHTSVDTDGCDPMDISVDATYLWVLCADKSGRRIVLSSITTVSDAVNTIDSFNIPSVSMPASQRCHHSEIFSDGTYVGVSDFDGTALQGSATFAHGTTPTLSDIGSMSFPLFSCNQDLIKPLVIGSTTYNFYLEKLTGVFANVSMENQWAQIDVRVSYDSNNLYDSMSVGGGQLWVHPTNSDKALRFNPANLASAPTTVTFNTSQINAVYYDGYNLWTTSSVGAGFADARNASTGAVVAFTNLQNPALVVRWFTTAYGVSFGAWRSATMVINTSSAPGSPTTVRARVNGDFATVTWKAPSDHGSAPITTYNVRLVYGSNKTAGECHVTKLRCKIDVSALPVATSLMTSVSATNSVGTSDPTYATRLAVTGDLVLFPDTSGTLNASQKDALSKWMKDVCKGNRCLTYTFDVVGYTDLSATGAVATQQCTARANAVVNYLKSIIPAGAGKNKPKFVAASGGATKMWDKKNPAGNRRVTLALQPFIS